jgi:pilus assembly protein CpaE
MVTNAQPRLIYFSHSAQLIESIVGAFANEPDYILLDGIKIADDPMMAIHQANPDIILLDFKFRESDILNIIDKITVQQPACSVIVLLPEDNIHQSNLLILAGARAFLPYPFIPDALVNTTRRVKELLARSSGAKEVEEDFKPVQANKKTFVVFSPKGGTGVTTIAINLAIALKQQIQDDLLLIDGKDILGHVAMMLNLRVGNSIADLIPHSGKLDQLLIKQVVVKHDSGIYVLPSSFVIAKAQGIRADDLYRVILALQKNYPYIIVDGGNYLNDNMVTYMDTADQIILVLNPNLASLRDARQFLDISKTLSYSKEKVVILLNQAGRKADIKSSEIEQVLQTKITGIISSDDDAVIRSINEGNPIILQHPNHSISKAVVQIARSILASSNISSNISKTKEVPSTFIEMLKKSSRLG